MLTAEVLVACVTELNVAAAAPGLEGGQWKQNNCLVELSDLAHAAPLCFQDLLNYLSDRN